MTEENKNNDVSKTPTCEGQPSNTLLYSGKVYRFKTWGGGSKELYECPFCGGEPQVKHIGNDYVKRRTIEVKCTSCRCCRRDGAIRYGFDNKGLYSRYRCN
jgi:hypothetical protein